MRNIKNDMITGSSKNEQILITKSAIKDLVEHYGNPIVVKDDKIDDRVTYGLILGAPFFVLFFMWIWNLILN